MKKILITGVAGFIGFHLAKKLIKNKFKVVGIDNLNNYYDVNLKKKRLKSLKKISIYIEDINNYSNLEKIFKKHSPDIVINFAAQAGVRYSLKYPKKYLNTNILGFFNVLELSKKYKVEHFIFASSSSVYGNNKKIPFDENQDTSKQTNIYGVTKKTNELMAHSYSYLYNLRCTALRYFTVFGPWGRPDMALFSFVKNILKNKHIKVYNNGNMFRDFTYIDDAINSTFSLIKKKYIKKKNKVPFEKLNIANSKPVKLLDFIKLIEKNLNKKAKIKFEERLKTEIKITHADTKKLSRSIKIFKKKNLNHGIKKFIDWYKRFYKIK